MESAHAVVELARLLRVAGYEPHRIQERLATGDQLLARSPELPSYLRRLGDGDELAVLLRLFLLGVPVPRARLDEVLDTKLEARLAAAGLLVEDAEVVHGGARLVPHDELLIASDHAGAAEGHADHVPGVHRPSVALAHLTVRGEGERALDVGTGNGIQAILLAAHAERVVATDVNPRALVYAAFNAALNGVGNVETRHGSFFEPVEGEQFDLVVANPPYVVSPESAYLFRDGGMHGDAVSEHVVRATPSVLAPGAFASILIAWALDPDDPAERPRSWLGGSGCDAFLLHTSTDDPVETATVWNRDLVDRPEAYADALDRWLAYYRRARDRAPGLRLPRATQAHGPPWRLARGTAAAAGGASPGGAARAEAVRDARPAGRVRCGRCAPRPPTCAWSTMRSLPRTRASRKVAGRRRA